mgnify:CR=1 FL=1
MDLEIIKIAEDTNNHKDIKNHTHHSKLKNHLCGDEIQIKLIIKNNRIVKFGYEGKSCVYCLAAASLLSKISMPVADARTRLATLLPADQAFIGSFWGAL